MMKLSMEKRTAGWFYDTILYCFLYVLYVEAVYCYYGYQARKL